MTDVSRLQPLAEAISTSSSRIRAWSLEQTRVTVEQETRLRKLEAVPTPAPTPAPTGWPKRGISPGYKILTRSDADQAFELDQCQQVGAQFVRVDSNPGNQALVDRIVPKILARNLEPMLILHGSSLAFTPTVAAEFARAQGSKWLGKVRLFEFCNEPDWGKNWTPESYTAALRGAYPALKQANPDARLIAGALFKWTDQPGATIEWVKRMYAAGLKGHMDALSLHLYDDPMERGSWNIWDWAFVWPNSIRALMDSMGDGHIGICSTENGGSVARYGEARQAQIVSNDFKALTMFPLLFQTVYSMMDDDVPGFGLLRPDRSRRSSWDAYRAAASVGG